MEGGGGCGCEVGEEGLPGFLGVEGCKAFFVWGDGVVFGCAEVGLVSDFQDDAVLIVFILKILEGETVVGFFIDANGE